MDKTQYLPRVAGHALVLGNGGIGTEVIRAMVAYGAPAVSFTYRSKREAAEALKAELEHEGVKVYIEQLAERTDATEAAFRAFLQRAEDSVGEGIVAAVDTIGISPNVPLAEQTLDSVERDREGWQRVMEVNVFGAFLSTRAILERMKSNKIQGSVVLITSTNGVNSYASLSMPYDASKAALVPMMRSFAEDYAPYGIRVNGIAPGWIETELNRTLDPEYRDRETRKIWSGRFADPREVATTVAFLSSSAASYIHGQNILVDGGYR